MIKPKIQHDKKHGRVWGRHAPTRSLRKCGRIAEVKSRMDKKFSRIENLWPRDGSCPLPLRSKSFPGNCFRIVKAQKISREFRCSCMWVTVCSERSSCPCLCSGVDEKSISRSVGSWDFQGAFPVKEKYRPCSIAMDFVGWNSGKMNRVCCGAVNLSAAFIGCGLLISAGEHDQNNPPYQASANNVNTS